MVITEFVLKNAKFQDKFQCYLPMLYPGHLNYLETLVVLTACTSILYYYTGYYVVDLGNIYITIIEPRHVKTSKMCVRPAKPQFSQGIRQFWDDRLQ